MPKKRVQRMQSNNEQKENKTAKCRKRKATSPLEGLRMRPRTSWNIITDETKHLLQDMGVEYLNQGSLDNYGEVKENTPAIWGHDSSQGSSASFHLPPVPGAPRLLLPSQRDNITSGSETSSETRNYITIAKPVSTTPSIKTLHLLSDSQRLFCRRNKPDSQAIDYFSNLSDEIILCIFGWLPKFVLSKCSTVCRRWSRLVLDESLWKRMDLSNKTLREGILGNVLNRGVWALRLAKTEIEAPIFTGPTSPIKCTRLSKVQYLDLSMAGTTTDVLEQLFCICKDLRKLSLENLELNDKICSYIGENKELEVLNLAMCSGITANGLMPITSNCGKIESLHLGWTNLHRHSIVYLCLCLPQNLLKLNLSGSRENISDDEVLQLCKTCPNLRELDLSDSTSLTSDTVSHVIKYLPSLEYLALSRCYHVVPSCLPELTQLSNLIAIDVFGMLREGALDSLKDGMERIEINNFPFSSIARPTTGIRRTSIWGIRVRESII